MSEATAAESLSVAIGISDKLAVLANSHVYTSEHDYYHVSNCIITVDLVVMLTIQATVKICLLTYLLIHSTWV